MDTSQNNRFQISPRGRTTGHPQCGCGTVFNAFENVSLQRYNTKQPPPVIIIICVLVPSTKMQ